MELMRKEIIALALGISFGATAWAQLPNLLEGCFTDAEAQMDNSASFFSVWDCFYDDGKPLPPELQPNSVFSKIYASGVAPDIGGSQKRIIGRIFRTCQDGTIHSLTHTRQSRT